MPSVQSVTLAASAARTTSDSGSSVDGEAPARSAGITLDVTAVAGGTLAVVIETSETGIADSEWTTVHTFPTVGGTTKLTVALGDLKRYLRASWTIGGSSPSFMFSVAGKLYTHLITRAQLSAHMSPRMLDRLLDDAGTGSASEDAVNSILAYASNMLRGKLGTVDDLSGFTPETQSDLIRIGLDICQARAAIRHPELLRLDGTKLMDMAKRDLREIVLHGARTGVPERPPTDAYRAGMASGTPRGW